jgi:hypothetical protein
MLPELVVNYTPNRGGRHVQALIESQVCGQARVFGFRMK